MFKEEQPFFIDPWGHLADEILQPEITQARISQLNRFHHFESAATLVLTGASVLGFVTSHPELGMAAATVAMAGAVSWAETSNEILRLRIENPLLNN